jgi:hypothetical protein
MPNWSDTIIKLFVRPEHAGFTTDIIASLATPGMDTSNLESDEDGEKSENRWLDLEALLPVPEPLRRGDDMPEYQQLEHLGRGHWPRDAEVPEGLTPPSGAAAMIEFFAGLSDRNREALELRRSNAGRYGVDSAFYWQRTMWGTKWNATGGAPRIDMVDDTGAYEEFAGATMITYRITTPWSDPEGYMKALRTQCEQKGIGLRAWVSHEDGGSQWNPETESYETVWTPLDEYDVEMEDIPASDMLVIAGQGLRFGPAPEASEAVREDPIVKAMREHMR